MTSNIMPHEGRPGLKKRTDRDSYPKMFLFIIILCVFCTVTNVASISSGTCSVPNEGQILVRDIQNKLENWASTQGQPDPSILIALKLAKEHNHNVIMHLIQKIKQTAANPEMTSGKVALYVLALRSACQNPADVVTPEKHVNLIEVLEEKTMEEIKYILNIGTPKTTYYQLALDTLALCIQKSPELEIATIILAKAAMDGSFQFNGRFSVDTGAVASLALFCAYEENISSHSKLVGTIQAALGRITNQILKEQQANGLLGNIYSTGLAMQALSVTSRFYPPNAWNCQKTLNAVLKKITEEAFSTPAAASQILPSLVGQTYLDVSNLPCTFETVHYTVINKLIGPYFEYHTTVKVPKGSVLLAVLKAAQQLNEKEFSFHKEETSWGPMVVSISGLKANTNEKTYWQFLSGQKPLEQGVASYKPKDNEKIVAMFSRY